MKKLHIEIKGTGSLTEIIESVENTLRVLKQIQASKEQIDATDEEVTGTWTDTISRTNLTK